MKKNNKQTKFFNNLFWRISFIFLFIITIIGLTYVYITVYYSGVYFQHVNQMLNRAVAANIISYSKPLNDNKVNQPVLEEVFKTVMALNPGLELYLLDLKGNILSYSAPKEKVLLQRVNLEPVHQFIRTKDTKYITGDDPRQPGVKKVFSVAPVFNNGSASGYLYVILASEEHDAVAEYLKKNLVWELGFRTMIFTLLATLLLGLIFIRILTKNFVEIINVMQKFRQGDLNARVHVKSTGELKQLSDIFNEMADILTRNVDKLKEVEVLRRELIANVSHDLRTPISIIHGYVETLHMKEDTISTQDRKRHMNTILDSTVKLERLVNELFELSKLEANQVQPQKEPFYISELVSDLSNKYHFIAKHKSIFIDTVLAKDLPPVYADISLIERVMQNLLDNAIKFTPEGGKVFIQTQKINENVEITVTDTGIGIPEKERDNIFGRYYKVNNISDLKKNTGLGLAIVKKILDLHECSLDLISNPGGTSFIFRLPVYQP